MKTQSNNDPIVSIIVPVYNTEQYLSACVNSILCQTFSSYEIILVDDGSSDNSGAVCDHLAEEHFQVVVVHQKNKGASAARNTGLRASKGAWIMFVDSDDQLNDERSLERIMERTEGVDLVACGLIRIDATGVDTTHYPSQVSKTVSSQEFVKYLLDFSYGYLGFVWSKLYRKAYLSGILFDEELKFCEDQQFLVKYLCALNGKRVRLDNTLRAYKYFSRANSMMSSLQKGYNPDFFTDFLAYEKIARQIHHTFEDTILDEMATRNLIGSGCRILGMMQACDHALVEKQRTYIMSRLEELDGNRKIQKQIRRSLVNTSLLQLREKMKTLDREEKVRAISLWMKSDSCQLCCLSRKWKIAYLLNVVLGERGLALVASKI